MAKRPSIILLLGLVVTAFLIITLAKQPSEKSNVVLVPKDGTMQTINVIKPGTDDVLDQATFRYSGGNNEMVTVSTTDGDGSVSKIVRYDGVIWINDNWHLEIYWIADRGNEIEIRYEVAPGAASIFNL